MQAPKISLSVVSHRQSALCGRLLDDLRHLAPRSVEKLILTLNLPEDVPDISGLPFPVEVVRNVRPLGFAANHNQAFALVKSEMFAVLNPDLRLPRDPFPALILRLQDPAVGIVAPVVLEANGTVADCARRLVTPWETVRRRLDPSARLPQLSRPDWLAGMFLAATSRNYAALGGFDTRFTMYCEDVDLCARVRLRGLRLEVAREVDVIHYAQRASRHSLRPMLLHISSLFKLWGSPVYRDYRALLRSEGASFSGS